MRSSFRGTPRSCGFDATARRRVQRADPTPSPRAAHATAGRRAARRASGSVPSPPARTRAQRRPVAGPFAASDAANDIGVSLLRPLRDEAEPARRAGDVLLDRRLLEDEAPERIAEPVPAGEADRAMVTPRPHLEELDLHVEVVDPGEVVPQGGGLRLAGDLADAAQLVHVVLAPGRRVALG